MKTSQAWWAGVLILGLVTVAAGNDARAASPIFSSGALVAQIGADPLDGADGSQGDTTVEPHVAVDPHDPSIVVAVFQEGRFVSGGAAGTGYATSHDGGRTWISRSLPGLTIATGGAFDRATDPAVAIGPDGAVYAQSLLFDFDAQLNFTRTAVVVQRSDDGGLTFGPPVVVQEDEASSGSPTNDKTWIAVDAFRGSPHAGRIYSAWGRSPDGFYKIVLRFSDDRGATWSGLVAVSPTSFPLTTGALPVVLPGGDLVVFYGAVAPCRVVAQTSHDGGEHFDTPVTIAACTSAPIPGLRTGTDDFSILPAAAVDPLDGRLYVAWEDVGFRPDGKHDIVLSLSVDGGASWTMPRAISPPDPAGRVDRFTPAVAAEEGALLVTYRAREGQQNRVSMRSIVSVDAAASFGRERRIGSDGDLRFAAQAILGASPELLFFLGDYMGLAMSRDAVYAVWCNPSRPRSGAGTHQTTWGARIPRRSLGLLPVLQRSIDFRAGR